MNNDRRKYFRNSAVAGAYVVFGSDANPCQIVDLSQGGLSVLFADKGDVLKNSFELALILDENEIRIEKIPFEIITNFTIARDMSLGDDNSLRRIGLKFGELTAAQGMQLKHFLWFASSKEM